MHYLFSHNIIKFYLFTCWVLAIVILMIEPVQWLFNTWFDPAYDSQGLLIAGLMTTLILWSISSPRKSHIDQSKSMRRAFVLFIAMACVRLSGQFLGINMLSALALVIDVYAIGLLLGISQRERSLSPAWIALLFAFSLPVERIIQRILGFPLQLISAKGSCSLLEVFNNNIQCNGVEMILNKQDVLVDLPCSGARGLIQLLILFILISCVQRINHHHIHLKNRLNYLFTGFTLVMISAYAGNVLRITILALGIAYPEALAFKIMDPETKGIDVMAAPWHDIIGLICLILSAIPLLWWFYIQSKKEQFPCHPTQAQTKFIQSIYSENACHISTSQTITNKFSRFLPIFSPLFVVIAILITFVSAHPLDVVKTTKHLQMPQYLNGYYAAEHALSKQERLYFTQYGGHAHKVSYGDFSLLQVSTRAPLRHLHAPQQCLTGSGHQVNYLGYSHTPLKAAVYKSISPQGDIWRISVTFLSSQGQQTTNIAKAIWLWLKHPKSRWTMLQRISPWDTPHSQLVQWDEAVITALEIDNLHLKPAIKSNLKQSKGDSDNEII